jgi:hypothetical protein
MSKRREYVRFLKPRAVKLLRRVQAHIREEPLRFHMDFWCSYYRPDDNPEPHCNTVGCIGGWIELLGNRLPTKNAKEDAKDRGAIVKDAYTLLSDGPATPGGVALRELFMNYAGTDSDPRIAWAGFGDATAGTPAQQVARACEVIDRFIERHALPGKGA